MPELTVQAMQEMACAAATNVCISTALWLRVVAQESAGWNPNAGDWRPFPTCIGLCQLNERFAKWFILTHGMDIVPRAEECRLKESDYWTDERLRATLLGPFVNLTIGAREMARLLRHFGTWEAALAGWNWGSGYTAALMADYPQTWMSRLPHETQYMQAIVLLDDGIRKYHPDWRGR